MLEVLIGLSVFLIAFLLVYGVFPMNQRALAESRNQMVANNIARDFLEQERQKDLSRVARGTGTVVVTDTQTISQQVEGRDSAVDYQVTVTGDDGPVSGTRLIDVTVSWTYGGLQHKTSIQTLVSGQVLE